MSSTRMTYENPSFSHVLGGDKYRKSMERMGLEGRPRKETFRCSKEDCDHLYYREEADRESTKTGNPLCPKCGSEPR